MKAALATSAANELSRWVRQSASAMLSRTHLSKPRNLLIAETFHRTGAVETWGRGTNRVIEACRAHGIPPPTFEEKQRFLVVTFRMQAAAIRPAPTRDQVGTRWKSCGFAAKNNPWSR